MIERDSVLGLGARSLLRDYVARLIFVMVFVHGDKNLADTLTKAQTPAMFGDMVS